MDAESLLAVVRVCRSWAADGMPFIWRHATETALVGRPSYGNFNYAAWIRSLTLLSALPDSEALGSWPPALPRLQQLTLHGRVVQEEVDHVRGGEAGRFQLLLARFSSPSLPFRVSILPGDWFLMFDFAAGEDIVNIGQPGSIPGCELFPEYMLKLLASRRHLTKLACHWPLGRGAILGAVAGAIGYAPFRDLKALHATLAAASAPVLLHGPMEQSLTDLDLNIYAGAAGVLPAVARLLLLRSLQVRWSVDVDVHIAADDILALRCLSRLRKAHIMGVFGHMYAPGFGERECAQLVAGWPLLREWDIWIEWGVSPTAFPLIGQHCRELRKLNLFCPSSLSAFEDPALDPSTPLFPQLLEANIGDIVGLEYSGVSYLDQAHRAITLARLICLHMPNLKAITLRGVDPVVTKIKQHIDEYLIAMKQR